MHVPAPSFQTRCGRPGSAVGARAFTLIELILVMVMMLVVLSMAAPALSNFFRGRSLDSEARRFLTLTRYAQSRAVAESIPMVLWINPATRSYGLRSEYSFSDGDEHEVEYRMSQDVLIEVDPARGADGRQMSQPQAPRGSTLVQIRFSPDGFLSDSNPEGFWLRENVDRTGLVGSAGSPASVWIRQNSNRLNYRVETNTYAMYR